MTVRCPDCGQAMVPDDAFDWFGGGGYLCQNDECDRIASSMF